MLLDRFMFQPKTRLSIGDRLKYVFTGEPFIIVEIQAHLVGLASLRTGSLYQGCLTVVGCFDDISKLEAEHICCGHLSNWIYCGKEAG